MQQGAHLWLHSCIPAAPPHQGQEGDVAHGAAAGTPSQSSLYPAERVEDQKSEVGSPDRKGRGR